LFWFKVSKFQMIFLLRKSTFCSFPHWFWTFCTSCWIEFLPARLMNFDILSSLFFDYINFYLFLSNPLHNVSFDWFLSGLEWIFNLELRLLKLLIFYQKLLWIIRSRSEFLSLYLNIFDQNLRFFAHKASILINICIKGLKMWKN